MSKISGYSLYHFQRLFILVSGIPISEYIRRRKLSMAALDLKEKKLKVIDAAMKYGYSSPTSFNRAFKEMHGVAPSEAKKKEVMLNAYAPLSFHIVVEGGDTLRYRIIELPEVRVIGYRLRSTLEDGQCYSDAPKFWQEIIQSGKLETLIETMNHEIDGVIGISNYQIMEEKSDFDFYIAVTSDKQPLEGMEEYIIPKSTWAIFECIGKNPEAMVHMEHRVVSEWLPSSGYEFANAPDIELHPPGDNQSEAYYSEVWIPVKKVK
ncbi:effector binding domain-containing protein [Breznakia sp. OttesenSCG-928-G09]|nr:effector binding domain-containing protein [Breznakia sp. OttesenSCG-928-G09]